MKNRNHLGMITAALLTAAPVAAAENGQPFLPYRYDSQGNRINYTPEEIVDTACRIGKLDELQANLRRKGLDIVGLDCAETQEYLREHVRQTLCELHEQNGLIVTEDYTVDGNPLRPLVRECYPNELSYQITDARGEVRAALLSSCANSTGSFLQSASAQPKGVLLPAAPSDPPPSIVCPPQLSQDVRSRHLAFGGTMGPWRGDGSPGLFVTPSFGNTEVTTEVPCRRVLP